MSSEKNRSFDLLAPKMKDLAILVGWISGLILIASLTWYFSQPLRDTLLIRAINKVLIQSGDSRLLTEKLTQKSAGTGAWYAMVNNTTRQNANARFFAEGTRAFVFVFIGDGYFFPCAAVVAPEGHVEEFIPLNNQGKRIIKQVSPGILRIYSSRIEGLL